MHKKKYIWLCLLLICSLLTGCTKTRDKTSGDGSVGTQINEQKPVDPVEESPALEVESEDIADKEETQEEPSSDKQEWLEFVDAFGESYQTIINKNVKLHPYDLSAFTKEGQVLSYEDENYTSRMGIDVSHHQGEIDWQKVKDFGVEFAFARIGYRGYGESGSLNLDQKVFDNLRKAQDVGMDTGVYFFSQAINEDEAYEEAQYVIDALSGYQLTLPVVYDPESILDDVARTDDVSGEQFTANSIAFCEAIRDAGYEPMIYSNMLWEAFELDLEKLKDYEIWYADYEPLPQTPYHFTFWQYTNEATVPGIDGVTDLDIQILKK